MSHAAVMRFDDLQRELRHACRTLTKNPGFTAVAVLTLALGIGANTAIFSVSDALLLRPLPYRDADRLVALRSSDPSHALPDGERTSPANLADWQRQAQSFEAIAGYRWRTVDLTGGPYSERLRGLVVTPEYFEVFGIRQMNGRAFTTRDQGTSPMVLGRDVWQRRFGADQGMIGKPLDINHINLSRVGPTPHVVLGVVTTDEHFPPLTADFQLGISAIDDHVGFWLPQFLTSADTRDGGREFDVVGKLRPGITIAQAQADMDAIARHLAQAFPASNRGWGVRVIPLRSQVLGNTRRVVVLLSLSTAMVLLIACGNVASLLLARGLARQREVAIRTALGAGRVRIVRQFLIESALMALTAAALGVSLTVAAIRLLRTWLPSTVPLIQGISINARVLSFTLASAVVTACVTGIFPAWRISGASGLSMLGLEARGLSAGRRRRRAVGVLVAAEVALTLVLLISTGLMVKSAARLWEVDPGFNPDHVLTMTISLPNNKFEWRHNVVFSRSVIASVKPLTSVRDAAVIQGVPMRAGSFWGKFEVEGTAAAGSADLPVARLRVVSPGYFGVMQIPIVSGRDFDARDDIGEVGHPRFVIVNRALATRYWPGENAVGKRMHAGNKDEWGTIAGVVGDVRYAGMDTPPDMDMYLPEGLFPQAAITLLVRTSGDPLRIVSDVRSRVGQVDREAFVTDIQSMGTLISESLAPRRVPTMLLTAFAGIGLLLAFTGIYSVIAQSVVQRQLEIGIRMALGAVPKRVLGLILQLALFPSIVGITVGLAGAVAMTRLLSAMLFGVRRFDPATWVMVSLLTLAVCLLAGYIPARRATKVDPVIALRCD
jgi:predicted permease